MALPSIQSRILATISSAFEDEDEQEVIESVRSALNLPKIVPEIRLTSSGVTREHFIQWDPQVFAPGPIWNFVSFPAIIYESHLYLFIAVLFFSDNNMRAGEPRVWKELCDAWDATFGLAPGQGRPDVNRRRYGSLLCPDLHPLDYAISGECHRFTGDEDRWLRDCLNHYQPSDSLEKLHDVRSSMVSEGPRWWRTPENGDIVWMPKRFWGANGER
jgi:hypothetical protein